MVVVSMYYLRNANTYRRSSHEKYKDILQIVYFVCLDFLVASIFILFNLSFGAGSILYTLNNVNPLTTVVGYCKTRIYFLQSSAMVYRWCLVFACFDRFMLLSINAHLREFAQVHVARRVVLFIVSISFVSSAYLPVFYDIKAGNCGIVYNIIASIYHSIFTIVFGSILPVSFMITCAILIHRNLGQKRQRRQQTINEPAERKNKKDHIQRKRDQQVLKMLLIQAFVFVVLTTPLLGNHLYIAVTIFVSNKSSDRLAIERFVAFLVETLMLLFTVISFYLYTLVSDTFRAELVRLIKYTPICQHNINNRRIEPLVDDTRGGTTGIPTFRMTKTATVVIN